MSHPLSKFADLDPLQLQGMITHTHRVFPYLEISSIEDVLTLCNLMIQTTFMLDTKPTPIRASYDFLRTVTEQSIDGGEVTKAPFSERDMVFAVKMFGLRIRISKGLLQFVPNNEFDDKEDEEFLIDSGITAKKLEFYISDVHKRTKIHTHTIQSASNKLLREWRELQLAKLFADLVHKKNRTIGQAREYLRTECGVKDHEFVRIRAQAIALGWFQSRRSPAKANRRITLDEDNLVYVEEMAQKLGGRVPLSMSAAANSLIRDFRKLSQKLTQPEKAGKK